MSWKSGVLLFIFSSIVWGDPPGSSVVRQVSVPAALAMDVFSTPQYLTIPPGFDISVWARVAGARFMAVAPNGDVFVSQPSLGQVTVLRPNGTGIPSQYIYVRDLTSPQGLAFDTINGAMWLYVGETTQISRYPYKSGDVAAPQNRQVLVNNLEDAGHPFKDIAIGPDHTVYFGFGSTCNACATDTYVYPEPGAVYAMNPDGSGLHIVASGLRNPEALAILPGTNTLWAAVNNRDDIPYPYNDAHGRRGDVIPTYVDDHPPEPFTSVQQGANYGWPFCNPTQDTPSGYNFMPFDNDQDTNGDGSVDCSKMTRIVKGIQAHSAPLGLSFLQNTNFLAAYRNGAVLAYHGSWDRTVPTGYKVVWFPWNSASQAPGDQIDLVTGFYGWGRPVDVQVTSNGSLLISDDLSNTVYRMVFSQPAVSAANGYATLAPGSYATIYGSGLATQTAISATPQTTLGGVSLDLLDGVTGTPFHTALIYVSPTQINFVVPDGIPSGSAQIFLNPGPNARALGWTTIQRIAPGLFSIDGSGSGTAAALSQTGFNTPVPVFTCAAAGCSEVPIDVSGAPVYLSLYGTGIRGAAPGTVQVLANRTALEVQYAGPQGTFAALDQVNTLVPASFAHAGEVSIQVLIDGVSSNTVTVRIK